MGKRAFPPLQALYAVLCCCLFTGVLEAQPFNDLCDDAELLLFDDSPAVTIDGDTADGATDDPENDTCGNSSAPGLWYAVEGTGDWLNATTCAQAQYDTRLSVFTIPGGVDGIDIDNPCAELTCLTQNDDACGFQSTVRWLSEEGGLYYILVHGYSAGAGTFSLTVEREVPPDPNDRQENDLCDGAITLALSADDLSVSVDGSTSEGANDDPENDSCGNSNAPGIWFSVAGLGASMSASTCGTAGYDTMISVFTGDCGAVECVASNDDGPGCAGFTSHANWEPVEGATYYILVHGFSSSSGDFTLTVESALAPPVMQDNDDCAGAIALDLATGQAVVSGTTAEGASGDDHDCSTSDAPGLWYSAVGNGQAMLASLCGSTYDTKLSVFTGDCGAVTCLSGNDDSCGLQSEVSWNSEDGVTYLILVHGYSTRSGDYILTISAQGLPGNLDPPAPPEGLVAVAGEDSVELDWNDNTEEDLASYKVYRSSFGKFPVENELIARGLTESSHVDDNLPFNGITYGYSVTAVASSGAESDPSDSVFLTFPPDREDGGGQVPSDFNQDSQVDISDAIALFGYLFLGQERPACPMGLDFNGDENLDISDGIGTLGYLFQGGAQHALGTGCSRIEGCPEACAP